MPTSAFPQQVLIASALLASWLGMQAVHELGHVVGAWVTGGRVANVVLHPLTISRTDMADNPRPLAVAWAGPVIGAAAPVLIWLAAAACGAREAFLARFFAGFCLAANGLYIGVGSFARVGDCGEMLRNGSPPWQLWLFGACSVPLGFWLWHRQGVDFGLGRAQGCVSRRAVYVSLAACGLLMLLGIVVGA